MFRALLLTLLLCLLVGCADSKQYVVAEAEKDLGESTAPTVKVRIQYKIEFR